MDPTCEPSPPHLSVAVEVPHDSGSSVACFPTVCFSLPDRRTFPLLSRSRLTDPTFRSLAGSIGVKGRVVALILLTAFVGAHGRVFSTRCGPYRNVAVADGGGEPWRDNRSERQSCRPCGQGRVGGPTAFGSSANWLRRIRQTSEVSVLVGCGALRGLALRAVRGRVRGLPARWGWLRLRGLCRGFGWFCGLFRRSPGGWC